METVTLKTSKVELKALKNEISENAKKIALGVSAICGLFLGVEIAVMLMLGNL